METDHWNKRALNFLLPHFSATVHTFQIATGFFSVQGYDLVKEALQGKHVQILVGYDEKSKERLKQKLIESILAHLALWDTENRRKAVISLVEMIRKGRFQIAERLDEEILETRVRNKDHAKIFILDHVKAVVGSINLTENGLLHNAEGGTLQADPDRVKYFVSQFLEFWNHKNTLDLTQDLLEALLKWLNLSFPFDVYLKTIQELIDEEELEPPRGNYKMPVNFQQVVISRVIRQIKDYRGAMLIASTGLGKTVMGTHIALRLKNEGKILNILLFAPLQVHPDWRRAFKSAGLNFDVFTRELLDRPENTKGKKTRELSEAFDQIDDRYLIIIDESQYFRNQLRAMDGAKRFSFKRLMEIIDKKKAHVLLLTATPFSKHIMDINHQLLLLPHTADKKFIKPDGQFVFPGMIDEDLHPEAWKVPEHKDYFEHFINLPVSTVISTSQVAKDFATKTPEGEYIEFGEEKRWIPRISLTKVTVPLFAEEKMSTLLHMGIFRHKRMKFKHRDTWRISETTIQKEAEVSWMSSPAALQEVVQRTIEDSYKAQFVFSQEKRKELLAPILDQLKESTSSEDPKFQSLVLFLKKFKDTNRKVILFTERYSSAIYLEKALTKRLPFLKVANTVKETKDGPVLKNFEEEVLPLIKSFAPYANKDKINPREKLENFDLFISTDAYSTGVNLEDASVVINYDLAWTPDVIIQRAGRILRFWKEPRQVSLIVFVGGFREYAPLKTSTTVVESRFKKLSSRSKQAERFSEIPVLPMGESQEFNSLGVLSSIKIEDMGWIDPGQVEEFSGVSPFLRHVTALKENQDYANSLLDDISSAMTYSDSSPRIYLLLKFQKEAIPILYDVEKDQVEKVKEDALLKIIQCQQDTPVAEVDPDKLERLAQRAKNQWMQKNGLKNSEEVQRICALYLIPERKKETLEALIQSL